MAEPVTFSLVLGVGQVWKGMSVGLRSLSFILDTEHHLPCANSVFRGESPSLTVDPLSF